MLWWMNMWAWILRVPGFEDHTIKIEGQRISFYVQKGLVGYQLMKMNGRWRVFGPSWSHEEYELNYNRCYNWYFFKAEEIRQVVFAPPKSARTSVSAP